jgi:HK97 family phage portal protein
MTLDELALALSGPATATGRRVSTEGALANVTVYACVRLIAESVGMLPLILYRRLEPRGKERATSHPLYTLLHQAPNREQTPIELLENMAGHIALWGNAYCEIEFDGAGRRVGLWPLRPDRMTVEVDGDNQRVYIYQLPSGEYVTLPRYRVWHVRGWGTEAWTGKSPIALSREAIGLGLATEAYGARFFGNDSRPGGVLRHPAKLSNEAAKRLRDSWNAAHQGLDNSHRVAVLEEGVEWQQIGIPPEEAQFLETRKFQETQICQIYRVPPHMIGITERSTSWGTGIEQQSIGFLTFTLMPYLLRISQSVSRDLMTPAERRELFAEFLTPALERSDIQARYAAYNTGRTGGWLSVNDIREMENMNPIENGDVYLQPLYMVEAGETPDAGAENGGDDESED